MFSWGRPEPGGSVNRKRRRRVLSELERIGERHSGWALLELLRLNGWDVAETIALGGGHLVLATSPAGWPIRKVADTFAEASLQVFQEAAEVSRVEGQLELVRVPVREH